MNKWEYSIQIFSEKELSKNINIIEAKLKEMGNKGFELVNIVAIKNHLLTVNSNPNLHYYFKREIKSNFEKCEEKKVIKENVSLNKSENTVEQKKIDQPSSTTVMLVPGGMNHMDSNTFPQYLSSEFDRIFGSDWTRWLGNSNAEGCGLAEEVYERIRVERNRVKSWYQNFRSDDDMRFDAYWNYMKKISVKKHKELAL